MSRSDPHRPDVAGWSTRMSQPGVGGFGAETLIGRRALGYNPRNQWRLHGQHRVCVGYRFPDRGPPQQGTSARRLAAGWCVPSQQLAPVVDGIAEKYRGKLRVATVEVGPKTERLCRTYGVERLPVVMLFKDGEAKDTVGGAIEAATITSMLDTQLKPVVNLSELNFEREVVGSKVPVLVHFWAACASRASTWAR